MALSAPARFQFGIGIASPLFAKEICDGIDNITGAATTFTGANTFSGANAFTGGVTISSAALTITDVNIILSATTGTMLGNANTQKLGLWGATPVVQPSGTGELLGLNGNAATAANATNMNSNGNVGSTAYTLNDLVKALKQAGVIKS